MAKAFLIKYAEIAIKGKNRHKPVFLHHVNITMIKQTWKDFEKKRKANGEKIRYYKN